MKSGGLNPSRHLTARLSRLDSHLAYVVLVHLFAEHLLNQLVLAESPLDDPRKSILDDHRSYGFSVKLTVVFHMGVLPKPLFHNLRRLNQLRNEYAHKIDVNLAKSFDKGFVRPDGRKLFGHPNRLQKEIDIDPAGEGIRTLAAIRRVTFDWLIEICRTRKVDAALPTP